MSSTSTRIVRTALLLAVAALASAQAPGEPVFVEGVYTETLDMLRAQYRNMEWAVARVDRLKGILIFAKDASTASDRSAEERHVYKDDVAYVKNQIVELQRYLRREAKEYIKSVESYLRELKLSYREIADWEKMRRSVWKKGLPRFALVVSPPGPIDSDERVRFELPGLPRGSTVTWKASHGEIRLADPSDPFVAIWTSTGAASTRITADVDHPKIRFPLVLTRNIPGFTGDEATVRQDYEDDLAILINMDLGKKQHVDELDRVSLRLRESRRGGAGFTSSYVERLQERKELLKDDLELQEDWIRYIDQYSLPFMAENDVTGAAVAWEKQRKDIERRFGEKGEHWPWHIQPGENMSTKTWHYVLKDLPLDSTVRWTLGRDPESASDVPGNAEKGVYVSPHRRRTEILSAHLELQYCSLPIRIDWIIPGSERSAEELAEERGAGDEKDRDER